MKAVIGLMAVVMGCSCATTRAEKQVEDCKLALEGAKSQVIASRAELEAVTALFDETVDVKLIEEDESDTYLCHPVPSESGRTKLICMSFTRFVAQLHQNQKAEPAKKGGKK